MHIVSWVLRSCPPSWPPRPSASGYAMYPTLHPWGDVGRSNKVLRTCSWAGITTFDGGTGQSKLSRSRLMGTTILPWSESPHHHAVRLNVWSEWGISNQKLNHRHNPIMTPPPGSCRMLGVHANLTFENENMWTTWGADTQWCPPSMSPTAEVPSAIFSFSDDSDDDKIDAGLRKLEKNSYVLSQTCSTVQAYHSTSQSGKV
jgi:hypothetical protein